MVLYLCQSLAFRVISIFIMHNFSFSSFVSFFYNEKLFHIHLKISLGMKQGKLKKKNTKPHSTENMLMSLGQMNF